MAVLLDSANLEEIRLVAGLHFISGVTSNPTLLLRGISARKDKPAGILTHLEDMAAAAGDKLIWSQVPTGTASEMCECGKRFAAVASGRFVVKVPCTPDGIEAAKRLAADGIQTCVTAVYSAAQCLVVAQENIDYVASYWGRLNRAGGDARELFAGMARIIKTVGSESQLLAASIQSPREAADALLAGAQHVSVPYAVLTSWLDHPLTGTALQQFDKDWKTAVATVGE